MEKGRRNAKRKASVKRKPRIKKSPVRKKRATVKRKKVAAKRKRNPSTNRKIADGIDLYRRFTGMEPKYIKHINNPSHLTDVAMEIGKCDGVLYTTTRDGKVEKYIHEFTGRSRPILASSWDGKEIFFVDGNYDFTEDGIVDR